MNALSVLDAPAGSAGRAATARRRIVGEGHRLGAGLARACGALVLIGIAGAAGALRAATLDVEPWTEQGLRVAFTRDGNEARTFDSVLLHDADGATSQATIVEDGGIGDGIVVTDEAGEWPINDSLPQTDVTTLGEALHACCPSFGRRGCGPVWHVQVDALLLWRSNMQSVPLFLDSLGGVALDANQVQPPMSAGPRVGVIRRIGPCAAIEGNYFNVSPFAGQAVTPVVGGPFTMTNFGDLVFDDITTATLTSNARIQSAELNWRRSIGPAITWLAGFRWVQWNEQMAAAYAYDNPDPPFDSRTKGTGTVTANTGNDLYGGQIGVDAMLWDRGGRWKVNGLGKAGVYYNHAFQNSGGGWVPLPEYGEPYTLPTVSASADRVAFFGEVGLNSTYWLTPWLGWRAGYSLFWLSGVAVAPQQFALASYGSESTSINTAGSVFLHGVTTGLEARW